NAVSKRVFPLRQLLARTFRILILRVLPAAAREIFHVLRNLALPRSRLRRTLAKIGNLLLASWLSRLPAALSARTVHLLQTLLRLLQTVQRTFVLCDRLLRVIARRSLRLLHLVGGLVELAAQLLHLCVATFARKSFQLTRGFASLFNQLLLLTLIAARSVCRSRLLASPLFLECLLLASREFFEPLFGFALLTLSLLLLCALHGLILVLHLVKLELEKTSEFLLFSFTTTATAAAALIAKRDLHFTEDRIGRDQSL